MPASISDHRRSNARMHRKCCDNFDGMANFPCMNGPRPYRPQDLTGRSALVTGASGDIGGAIAIALAARGASVILSGRDAARLEHVAAQSRLAGQATIEAHAVDLADDGQIERFGETFAARRESLEILVHAAGAYARGDLADTPVDELDRLYRTNLRAPYKLTQLLLPLLRRNGGDVVLVNSSQARSPGRGVAPYAATQRARDALAEILRAEVNEVGIRVLSVFLGRTAGRLQADVFSAEGRPYLPEKLLQPEDVAEMVAAALSLPRRAEVMSMSLRPAVKSY
jgi:NADP-dependent 3-hydroxy acid dehydrogenase YdfG